MNKNDKFNFFLQLVGWGVNWTTKLFQTRLKIDKNNKSNFWTRPWVGVE